MEFVATTNHLNRFGACFHTETVRAGDGHQQDDCERDSLSLRPAAFLFGSAEQEQRRAAKPRPPLARRRPGG